MGQASPDIWVIIPAAGKGARFGSSKALFKFRGKSVLNWTLRSFVTACPDACVVIAAQPEEIEQVQEECSGLIDLHVIAGGSYRAESVKNALGYIIGKQTENSRSYNPIVVIHDAARCLVSPELITRCIKAAKEHPAVTAALACVDTLIRVDEGSGAVTNIDRKGVYSIQTPQVFRLSLLQRAYSAASALLQSATDDASIVRPHCPIHIVEGERSNLKLTTPADIPFFLSLTPLSN